MCSHPNFDMSQNSSNKMTELIQAYDLKQLIQESTHYTENSSSVIDLILVRNTSNVLISCVTDCFLPALIRYHCSVVVLLKFLRPSVKTFKRRIWNYNLAVYDLYRTLLSAILSAAEESIPNKTITVRPAEHPWITCKIKNIILGSESVTTENSKNRKCFVFGKVQRHA